MENLPDAMLTLPLIAPEPPALSLECFQRNGLNFFGFLSEFNLRSGISNLPLGFQLAWETMKLALRTNFFKENDFVILRMSTNPLSVGKKIMDSYISDYWLGSK